jgi:hypothetical protein
MSFFADTLQAVQRPVRLSILFGSIMGFGVLAHAETAALTGDNFSLAATHLDANFDWKKRSLEYLRTYEAQRFASVMHDKAQTESARQLAEAKLRKMAQARINKVMKLTRRVLIDSIAPNTDDPKKYVIRMLPSFGGPGDYADSSVNKRGFAEDSYSLLLANKSLGDRFEVPKAVGEKLKLQFDAQQIAVLRMEADIEAVRLTQASIAHLAIRRVQWFEEKGTTALATLDEKAKSEELTNKRKLSEGYTLQMTLDHEGIYGTHRLNEFMLEDAAGDCQELPRERGHRVFTCTSYDATSANGKTRVKYVGGRGVIVELFMDRQSAPKDEAQLVGFLSNTYKMSPEAIKTWKWWQASAEVIVSKQDAINPDGSKPYLIATSRDYKKMLAGAKQYGVVK